MQPSGNVPQPRPGTSFKNGPHPQPSGVMTNPVVHVGGLGGSVVVQGGDARTDNRPHAPKPGP